jgi:hypothetical protein
LFEQFLHPLPGHGFDAAEFDPWTEDPGALPAPDCGPVNVEQVG